MDAPEHDPDIKLQKSSADYIADFDRSLLPLIKRHDANGTTSLRSRVRSRETARLAVLVLDPFQEIPQLLDPHLPKWIPILGDALLEYLQSPYRHKALSTRSELLMPLRTAICDLLYHFCKIRGEKVIIRFLSVEARYLELLLSALEDAERETDPSTSRPSLNTLGAKPTTRWKWEERYIFLLWLSHLFLAPFDLSTISSVDPGDEDLPSIAGFQWPPDVPGITIRVLPLAMKYLSSPGKERDAAKTLLVRIAMRRDMQSLGILDALVKWALLSLRPHKDAPSRSPYHYIGILSFLAGLLSSSADTSDMDKYLSSVFYATHELASSTDPGLEAVSSSALARKLMIKVIRSAAVLVLRKSPQDMASTELVESTIGFLLERLADNDTPVRFAASKALSIITLKLDEDMASQVIDVVLESLNRNVLWVKDPTNPSTPRTRDLTSVDALEWHGLMLTLSHLLYRRSPPAASLPDIIHALILGLDFERRNASGGSTGTNVRDAACFGIWAVARRYTTAELLAVPTKSLSVTQSNTSPLSVLQVLATELVVTASLDPAGNIRRGSSAALQELIGRHPDTVIQGIWVVQTVDYHAVALRSRSISEVALNATKLAGHYGRAILEGLLGWRGIGDADASARRTTALSFGAIMAELACAGGNTLGPVVDAVDLILQKLKSLQQRQVEERHGLILCFAAILDKLPELAAHQSGVDKETSNLLMSKSISGIQGIMTECKDITFRRPELVAEAASRLAVASFPIFQAAVLGPESLNTLLPGPKLLEAVDDGTFMTVVSPIDANLGHWSEKFDNLVSLIQTNLQTWLLRQEQDVIEAAAEAALISLVFTPTLDHDKFKGRETILREWAALVRAPPTSREGTGFGYFFALTMAHPILACIPRGAAEDNSLICSAVLERWASDKRVETRVAILQSLIRGEVLWQNVPLFLGLVSEGLDDYTTAARGDIGSHVRLQAIRATKSLWERLGRESANDDSAEAVMSTLFLRILRLAAEKLDRVRVEAQRVLSLALQTSYCHDLEEFTFSSKAYFCYLLNLLGSDHLRESVLKTAGQDAERWMEELMVGYVTSADTGNEELVIASRAALSEYCAASQENRDRICTALVRNLKRLQGQDRTVVSTLEIIAYLFYVDVFPRCGQVDYKNLCLQVQKAGYKTGNVRKLEACVKVYGAIAGVREQANLASPALEGKRAEGMAEARKRLGALMYHPWPRIKSVVVDELWRLLSVGDEPRAEKLKSVDWGKAEKSSIKFLVEGLGLA
ncbi:uncharacterized protein E0L32_007316 [Thyridium curvatum]|uniref:Uncharacterized protein n=1 Tax=Thyridium curvatum TaxID=1093900 RepID=A0A507AWB0_9PEZI|nr:uncharacterized protein E0L32_007316 [Thyridium curvatum]TPX12013.1 hypothetical protein E0L32_007316 [Thyridium curvatum]